MTLLKIEKGDSLDLAPEVSLQNARSELFLRIQRYALARYRALVQLDYIQNLDRLSLEIDLERLAILISSLRNCGNYLVFRHYSTLNESRLHAAKLCRIHQLCPLCAIRRGAKLVEKYLARYQLLEAEFPELELYFFTFTVKDDPSLSKCLGHLTSSWKRCLYCRRAGANSKKRDLPCELNKILGAIYSYEVTYDKDWHPHIHLLGLCHPDNLPDFPYGSDDGQLKKASKLSQEWLRMTGDSFIVDGRPVDDPINGLLEICKYVVKFSALEPAQTWEAYLILRRRRLFGSFGLFRGIKESELEELDSLIDDSSLPYVEYFCHYVDKYYEISTVEV